MLNIVIPQNPNTLSTSPCRTVSAVFGSSSRLGILGSHYIPLRTPGISGLAAFFLGLCSVPAYSFTNGAGGFFLSLLPIGLLALFYLLLLRIDNGKRAFLTGFAYGLGLFLGGVSWVYVSLSDFAAMPFPLAMLLTLLFCACLALFPALAALLFHRLTRLPPESCTTSLVFAACFTLAELLRGFLLTGFPWLALGYSQANSPIAAYAGIFGVYGVGFFGALTAAWIATAFSVQVRTSSLPPRGGGCPEGAGEGALFHPSTPSPTAVCKTPQGERGAKRGALTAAWIATVRREMWWPLLAVICLWAGGLALAQIEWTQPEGEPVSVALIQGNVPQSLKWQPGQLAETLALYHDLIRKSPAQLVLLPETAFPIFWDMLPSDYLEALQNTMKEANGDLLIGVAVRDTGARYYNSAVSLGASPSQQYAKRHLVPFGELIPPGFRWFLRFADIPLADFSAGRTDQPPLFIANTRIAVGICYEDLFGEETLDFLPEAALLVNLSNTAWFGDSLAPGQHLQIARMRALETGRPMLRVGNTGVTALITTKGEVEAKLPAFTRAVLRVETHGYSGLTPYISMGNWPVFLLALISCLLPFLIRFNCLNRRQPRKE